MVGWGKGDHQKIVFSKDYSNFDHSKFLCDLVDEYISGTRCGYFNCGYSCSDHAAWYEQGYPSTLAIESSFSPYYHTESDSYKNIDKNYVAKFAKLAVVYLAELSKGKCEN